MIQFAVPDDDDGVATDQLGESGGLEHQSREQQLQRDEHHNGDQAVEQRHAAFLHGDRRQIGNEQRHHQLDRLQLPELPFAHDPHGRDNEYVDYHGADSRDRHDMTLPFT